MTACVFFSETVRFLPYSLSGYEEYKNTLNSTVFILQTMLGIIPEKDRLSRNTSRFNTIRINELYQSDLQKRRKCQGFLLLARASGRVVMSVTVWLKNMFDIIREKNVRVQEHALIVRNPYGVSARYPNLSLKMHSFAASVIGEPFVVCQPYRKMGQILKKAVFQEKLDSVTYLRQIADPCSAFGSSFQFVNDNRLQRIWKSCLKE